VGRVKKKHRDVAEYIATTGTTPSGLTAEQQVAIWSLCNWIEIRRSVIISYAHGLPLSRGQMETLYETPEEAARYLAIQELNLSQPEF
jgi:hypothetical protein